MYSPSSFEKSIIVVAHPDDEILWFSSILDKVGALLICFIGCKSRPDWTIGRTKSLSQHPTRNLSFLHIDQSGVFDFADWRNPVITDYGIQTHRSRASEKQYRKNYYLLKKNLEIKLDRYRYVITHNPWGEYGNEEHIQVYRVIKQLQSKMHFELWFSNYFSVKTVSLMSRYLPCIGPDILTLQTNIELARCIKGIYEQNRCWTWYDQWQWHNEESFIKDVTEQKEEITCGYVLPFNLIQIGLPRYRKRSHFPVLNKLLRHMKFF